MCDNRKEAGCDSKAGKAGRVLTRSATYLTNGPCSLAGEGDIGGFSCPAFPYAMSSFVSDVL